jgi:hypothetical protein
MKKLLFISLLALFLSCDSRMELGELTDVIYKDIVEEFKSNPLTSKSRVKKFTLVRKIGNFYEGILDVEIKNDLLDEAIDESELGKLIKTLSNQKYEVEVIYDGENYEWEIKD